MKLRSLKTRIGICIALSMTVVVCILSGVAYYEFREALWRSMDMTLQANMQQIKGILFSGDPQDPETQREIRVLLTPRSDWQKIEYQLWLEDAQNGTVTTLIASDLPDRLAEQRVVQPKHDSFVLLDLKRETRPYRIIWAKYLVPSRSTSSGVLVNLVLAVSSKTVYHEAGEFVRVLVVLGAIVVVVFWGLIHQILRWGLKPIGVLSDQMQTISEDALHRAAHDYSTVPRELMPFVKSWEAMLDRLGTAMTEQKRFIADAAHELKTPVALVKSTLQLAESSDRTCEYYKKTISNALEDIERLNHLIRQLLDLSRLKSGQTSGERQSFNLREAIEQVIESYRPLLEARGFTLDGRLCDAQLLGNFSQICQLFGNILDNAIKYGPPGTTITVSMRVEDGVVAITVHDEGGSIPPEECQLLFNRFYRVEKGRDRNSGGSGLGLAIAQGIAALHSGKIHVTSNRQSGTRFVVTLPTVRAAN